MDQNPYSAPKSDDVRSPAWRLETPTTWWFWIALILLVVGTIVVNQVGVMRSMIHHDSINNTQDR